MSDPFKSYFVYIMTNRPRGCLYIGVTSDISRRVAEHKLRLLPGFTQRYALKLLIYYESHESSVRCIQREKQLKNWHRDWKINLIESVNPEWKDLSEEEL